MTRAARALALAGLATLVATAALAAWAPGEPITAESWGRQVGFAPDLQGAPPAGTRIAKGNLAEWARWVPQGVDRLVERYALVIPVVDYEAVHPSRGYLAQTNAHAGKARLQPATGDPRVRTLEGYEGGLPFPDPKTGLEVAYNHALAYRGDDGSYQYGVFWISAASGVERWEEWRWEFILRTKWRTDIEPLPRIPELADEDIVHVSLTHATAPHDKRGFAALYRAYEDPRDGQGWVYLPPTRRTLRMSFGTRGDAWNSTDLLHEDVGGYAGHPEWMNWRIVGKQTVLAPVHAGLPHGKAALQEVFDFKSWPHWNLKAKWEPRPMYVVEATPRLPDYPYSRMTLYFDAETFAIPVKVAYDRKGELWKVVIGASNASPDMDEKPLQIGTALVVDFQAEHATAFPAYGHESNVGHQPQQFTQARLSKMSR